MMIPRHTGRDEEVPSLVIYTPIIDFDWPFLLKTIRTIDSL